MKRTLLLLLLASSGLLAGCGKENEKTEAKPETDQKRDENIVTLPKKKIEHFNLKIEPAAMSNLDLTLHTVGRVSANLNRTAKVTPTLEGRLVKLNFDLNDRVKAGDVLGLVETPEFLGRPLELKAPIGGTIVLRQSSVGELVDRSKEIYTISDPTNLWVLAEIKEWDIGVVKVGQEARFTVLPYGAEIFRGKITLIGNQIETQSHTLEVRINADNFDGRLKPGLFANVELVTASMENVLLIPDSALQSDGDDQIIFVALDGDKFEKRVVHPGLKQQGRVQILDGVKAGEKVVTVGGFILKSEMLKGEMTDKD